MEPAPDGAAPGEGAGRLDAEKLDVLRTWGTGLASDDREEVRAAGRAITLLIEEIDHLHVDLWHARDGAAPPPEPVEGVDRALRDRIAALTPLAALRRARPDS